MMPRKNWATKVFDYFIHNFHLFSFVFFIQIIITSFRPLSGVAYQFDSFWFLGSIIKSFSIAFLSALITFNKNWLRWMVVIINLFVVDFYMYLALQFKVKLTPNILALILQTNTNEATEFFQSYFSIPIILWLVATTLLFLAFYLFLQYVRNNLKKRTLFFRYDYKVICAYAIVLCFASSLIVNLITDEKYIDNGKPMILNHYIYEVCLPYQDFIFAFYSISGNEDKVVRIKNANDRIEIESCKFTSPNIILVIGESYNKYHASIYGYQHRTTPNLESEQNKGNLFVFSDAITHSAGTKWCMQSLYSTKSLDDDKIWEDSPLFPAIFKKSGYTVKLFDNQNTRASGDALLDYSTSFFINPLEINNQCFDYRNDRVYHYDLDMVKEVSDDISKSADKSSLVILHLNGQHMASSERYPKTPEFSVFNEDSIHRTDISKRKLREIAEYDNATRYNDRVVQEIFNLYKQKDAIVLYFGDHGDNIYDESSLTYGRDQREIIPMEIIKIQNQIPMFIWCSDDYIANHPAMMERIKKSLDKPFMHDDICHVLFDLAGIEGEFFDPTRSLINEQFTPRKRLILGGFDYDAHKQEIDEIELRTEMN